MDNISIQYGEEIRQYVNDNIINSLLIGYGEGVYMRNELERRNLTLCNKLLSNPALRDEIVAKIVSTGIKIASNYYRPNLKPELRKELFMRKIHEVLSLDQIVSYAVKFDNELALEQKPTR